MGQGMLLANLDMSGVKFGREEVLPWRGRYFTRILSLGGEFVLRIFSPPEEISGGRFYPVTPAPEPFDLKKQNKTNSDGWTRYGSLDSNNFHRH